MKSPSKPVVVCWDSFFVSNALFHKPLILIYLLRYIGVELS